jgi:hypothetical protein
MMRRPLRIELSLVRPPLRDAHASPVSPSRAFGFGIAPSLPTSLAVVPLRPIRDTSAGSDYLQWEFFPLASPPQITPSRVRTYIRPIPSAFPTTQARTRREHVVVKHIITVPDGHLAPAEIGLKPVRRDLAYRSGKCGGMAAVSSKRRSVGGRSRQFLQEKGRRQIVISPIYRSLMAKTVAYLSTGDYTALELKSSGISLSIEKGGRVVGTLFVNKSGVRWLPKGGRWPRKSKKVVGTPVSWEKLNIWARGENEPP